MVIEAFTYEDLYELLRTEKFSTDLDEIKKGDLHRIQAYLKTKEVLLKKQEDTTSILSSQKKIKIQQEIDNAIRALKDLYEIRERKIINRAVYGARTDDTFKDTTNMLENETELYEQMLEILRDQKEIFFKLIENASEIEEKNINISTTTDETETQTSYDEDTGKKDKESDIKFIEVSFIEDCPEMFGEDLEKYGPFKVNDTHNIPEQLFNILEKQKKVQRKQ